MPKVKAKPPEELVFEQALEELQEVVGSLESGELALEDSLKLFERGQALADRCSQLLEQAELRMRQLVPDERGGYREEDLEVEE
ncbi:MAG TPA: exodeoxyribonuclease VII small subunit [Anaerolineales bacterium]|nr:exodeoxyribonuclease VII small subunit [Anaerolineales bacterium]